MSDPLKNKTAHSNIEKETLLSEAHHSTNTRPLVSVYTPLRIGLNPFLMFEEFCNIV